MSWSRIVMELESESYAVGSLRVMEFKSKSYGV